MIAAKFCSKSFVDGDFLRFMKLCCKQTLFFCLFFLEMILRGPTDS